MKTEQWLEDPEEHDYPAAEDYLSLLVDPESAAQMAAAFRDAPKARRKAKDLLRASGLALLPRDNEHVAADLAKVKAGQGLSPVLLVRGDLRRRLPLTVADGYHRICASHHLDENADVPCRIVGLPDTP
ncbi:MAG TPA: hypothetical protein VGP46_01830 [Acidimicrobiales bacterium]|jgi:hypothetical protein|nr:hypothetical protein [Acidimicrobiales bacterium]